MPVGNARCRVWFACPRGGTFDETVYREDLRRNPENGWSLHGLERALRALGRADEADAVHGRFEKAWARADFQLSE